MLQQGGLIFLRRLQASGHENRQQLLEIHPGREE